MIRLLGSATLLAVVAGFAFGQYPTVERLDGADPLFRQHQQGIRIYSRHAGAGEPLPPLLIYRYEVEDGDTLFGVAARFSLPYSAIATLNRIASPDLTARGELLVPGLPGIFVPLVPDNDLESIIHDLRRDSDAAVVTVPGDPSPTVFRFFAGEDFLPEERTAFLGLVFRHPLPSGALSSPYGPRTNPVTAEFGFHGGADYAASAGTRVMAARGGRVAEIGFNDILGKYVILEHSGGFESVYGHLQSVAVSLNDEVRSGMILGAVGSTGMVTGPHLHFEIRQHGRSRDPEPMLP